MAARHNHSKIAVDEKPVNGSCNRKTMIRKNSINILIMSITLLLTLILLEIVVRVGGATDADGQFTFMGYSLEPYVLPINRLRQGIDSYLSNIDTVTIIYDEITGWAYRPESSRDEGNFTINGVGLRSHREYSQEPLPKTLRIAAFGDSFTAGDDVNDSDVWTNQLEITLIEAGIRAEVLNFGVGGFGMGQAYLRWQKLGRAFEPDIVIFGFQAENLSRNINIFRHLYRQSPGILFSKPRFILTDGELEVLNMPTVPPDNLMAVYESFANHPLAAYEEYYRSRDVIAKWWLSSRLAAFFYEISKTGTGADERDFGPEGERGLLGRAIVDAFASDVATLNAEFFIAHLPVKNELNNHHQGKPSVNDHLLDYFSETYRLIPFMRHLGPEYTDSKYWGATNHYGPEINQLLGEIIAEEIGACIESNSCTLTRFDNSNDFAISA